MFWNQTLNKLLDLNDKSKASLRNRLSEVKFLIISEFSMVSSDLWRHAASKLGEIFTMIPGKAFAGLSVTTVEDLTQLTSSQRETYFFTIFR